MNVLLTGANGFIGRNLGRFLEEKEINVFKVSRDVVDLADEFSVSDFVNTFKQRIDVVLHLAFKLASVDQTKEEQLDGFYDNLRITNSIIKIADIVKPKKIINFSSMAVYPNVNGVFSETSEICPSVNTEGMYGIAKFMAENLMSLNLKDIEILHLRLAQVYGEGMRQDRIVSIMKKELEEKNSITVFGLGERTSCFIRIDKFCKIIYDLMHTDVDGIFNVGDENISYYDLAKRIISKYGNSQSKILKVKEGSKSRFFLDCSKLSQIHRDDIPLG